MLLLTLLLHQVRICCYLTFFLFSFSFLLVGVQVWVSACVLLGQMLSVSISYLFHPFLILLILLIQWLFQPLIFSSVLQETYSFWEQIKDDSFLPFPSPPSKFVPNFS